MSTFGARVKAARESKQWTQERMARELGLYSGVVVSRWERDRAMPHDPDLIVRICETFGVSADWLLRGMGEHPFDARGAA